MEKKTFCRNSSKIQYQNRRKWQNKYSLHTTAW